MKTPEEFRSFYDLHLLPSLQVMEKERKSLFYQALIYAIVAVSVGLLVTVLFDDDHQFGIAPLVVSVGIAIGIYSGASWGRIQDLKIKFKNDVIARMVKAIDESLIYSASDYIRESEYHTSKLFLDNINRYKGDDLVTGTLGRTSIRFSELCAEKVTVSRDRDGKKKETVSLIFRGMFFVGDFNKKFIGETIVLPDTAESLFGSMGTMFQKMNISRDQLVKLEDTKFEKAFVVYSNDQVEARYILSTALMQRILEFRERCKKKVYMSFIDSKVFVAIPICENLFEPPFFRSMLDFRLIEGFKSYLILFVSIVEDLNLNTRIWTKE